jgi:polyisoprenyl-teichoic acid--peptidoglycan teichoic acid transferase
MIDLMTKTITRPTRTRIKSDRFTFLVVIIFFIIAAITSIIIILIGFNTVVGWESTSNSNIPVVVNSNTDSINLPSGAQANQPLQSSDGPVSKDWDGSNRVTALLMGLDYRDWEANEPASRTDSMMLITYDPTTNTAGMLSIPRDMWVNIPGFDYGKINTAYFLGEINNLPGGGPALAVQTVEQFLGVPINFYAQIDFTAFEKLINELGGLDIKIQTPITIDPLGPGNTKTLKPGTQTLTGAEALAYARQRHTDNGDIDRAQRQQDVIIAIRNQIFNLNMLPNLVAKSPKIYSDIASGMRTNLTLSKVVQLALAVQRVPRENIKQAVIGSEDTQLDMTVDGQSILIPIMDKILITRDSVFSAGTNPEPKPTFVPEADVTSSNNTEVQLQADEQDPVSAPVEDLGTLLSNEDAKLIVQNGTKTMGLAGKVEEYLKSLGMNIVSTKNADKEYSEIILIDYTGKTYTLQFLAEMLQVPNDHIFNQDDPNAGGDIAIILGENWQSVLNLP